MEPAMKIPLAVLLTLAIIYFVPFLVYGPFSALGWLSLPAGASPGQFLLSVLVTKLGIAGAFVLIIFVTRPALASHWLLYAFLWWLMFALGELGQAIGPGYTWNKPWPASSPKLSTVPWPPG